MKKLLYLNDYGRVGLTIVWIILLIVLVIGAGFGTYTWQHHKVDQLNKQVSDLANQLNAAKSQNQQTSTAQSTSSDLTLAGKSYTSAKGVKVIVYFPQSDVKVTNPLGVVGEVPGNWSNEATFPIQLKDSTGKVIAQGSAQLLRDWMTDQLVPFSAKLTYTGTPTGSGTLVLQKDNPSGLAKNSDTVSIPVNF